MHKQLLYVVKKTKILNKENRNNEVHVHTTTETNMGALLYDFIWEPLHMEQAKYERKSVVSLLIIFSGMTLTLVGYQITVICKKNSSGV